MKALNYFLAMLAGLIICISIPASLYAQDENNSSTSYKIHSPYNKIQGESSPQVGTHLGFRFLPTFTKFDVNKLNDAAKVEFVMGYGVGANIGYYFNNHIGTHLEIMYNVLNQKYVRDNTSNVIEVTYINIPLLVSFNSDMGMPVNFNVTAGPQFGINTRATLETEQRGDVIAGEAVLSVEPFDLGLAYGAGFDFGMGPEKNFHINLGFRGMYGLIRVDDQARTLETNQFYILEKSKLKTYAGYLGFSFKM